MMDTQSLWQELRDQMALLERDNQRYADFFEHAPDAYVITDTAGKVVQANRAAAELLAMQRAELIGRSLSDCVRPQLDCSMRILGAERRCWLMRAA